MPTSKHFFTGGLLFAYLLVGSVHYVADATKQGVPRATKDFADTLPRKVYKYSVVPGGVASPEDLARARRNDPVVAAHFADFGTNTRITTLQEDMYVYVSYRQGNKVYYTKKRHKVCKGEVVITDDKNNIARARCANRLSKVFRPPALAFDEPSAPQFDYIDAPESPEIVPGDPLLTSNYGGLPDGSGYTPPPQQAQTGANPGPPSPGNAFDGGPSGVIQPAFLPFAAGVPALFFPPSNVPPIIVVSTPEPAEWPFFLASSAIALWLFAHRKRSNKHLA